jgi:hypothetical protein
MFYCVITELLVYEHRPELLGCSLANLIAGILFYHVVNDLVTLLPA